MVFGGVRVVRSFVFCVVFSRSLFVLLSILFVAIVMSVLRFKVSDSPFGIFKLFLCPILFMFISLLQVEHISYRSTKMYTYMYMYSVENNLHGRSLTMHINSIRETAIATEAMVKRKC